MGHHRLYRNNAARQRATEHTLHTRFAHLRVSGEWFRDAEDLTTFLAERDRDNVTPSPENVTLCHAQKSIGTMPHDSEPTGGAGNERRN